MKMPRPLPAAGKRLPPGWLTSLVCAGVIALLPGAVGHARAAQTTNDTAVVTVGPGGYLTTLPRPCKPLPERIYRTADVRGPMLTGQWWSSLVWQPFSQNLFAHPLVLLCTSNGLVVSQHGARVHGTSAGIFGSGGGRPGDLRLEHSAAGVFPEALCGGYSDWFVTAVFATNDMVLRASFGHGSPYVFCQYSGGQPVVTFAQAPRLWAGSARDAVLGLTVNGHHYGLFGPGGSTWAGLEGRRWTNLSGGKSYFSVAVLPDDRPETLARFRQHAYNHVIDTRLELAYQNGQLLVNYRFTCRPQEGSDTGTLFALYPHQWKYTSTPLTPMTYNSVRGVMKVGEGGGFATTVPVQGLLPLLPPQGIPERERALQYLRAEAAKKPAGFGDTYWEGKHLGRLATLSGVAEAAGAPELQATFLHEIKRRLEQWFTAAPGKEQVVFYYNNLWGTLVGSRPSYGSDRPLNDHHFHYGYFIRAAAEVARRDAAWARQWAPMVELLIRDIASPDRQDPLFPYLRCFDKYAGHSWASGDANFADGNNQESSSESLNAWYGMMLWGEATGNRRLRDVGLALFNLERTAVEEYWFDVSGTNFPRDFPEVALGMVWGGKGAFATWFSGDIDCIHGINWLPFTPASIYMGRHPAYVKKNHDRIVARRKGGADYNNGWGDLVIMFRALAEPAPAAEYLEAQPQCKIESGNTHAFMYHWIHTLNRLGLNDTGLTADHPFFNVYQKNGRKTYAVYNFQAQPLTVTFSDGHRMTAAPGTLTVAP
ncbi:MAG: glycosyl hydrolase [Verrucomicrobiae bacterium]|nr:glycosyl hydrolase [Verrucomicrobiae bacterium]